VQRDLRDEEGLVRGDGGLRDYGDGFALVAVPGEEGGVTLKTPEWAYDRMVERSINRIKK